MEVIPVIDLKRGAVVHARGGRRDDYRPLETPLSASSAPADVVAGLLGIAPFRRLYVADLDAIEGVGAQGAALRSIAAGAPGLEPWVDNGAATVGAAEAWLSEMPGCLVIGSESQADLSVLRHWRDHPRVLLSLDFRGDAFRGPADLLREPALWPRRVIVMTLARVGAGEGPDIERVVTVIARAGDRQVHAAGGVRGASDLRRLAACGAAGVLVATALHAGAITAADIRDVARPGGRATPEC